MSWSEVLGVSGGASYAEIRQAWRKASFSAHPDHGGSTVALDRINNALEQALASIKIDPTHSASISVSRIRHDESSFTINMLPVESWPLMQIVAAEIGQIISDEEPYMIEFTLQDCGVAYWLRAWCRCDLVPEAGATMVHVTVGAPPEYEFPDIEHVRDMLVSSLNAIN